MRRWRERYVTLALFLATMVGVAGTSGYGPAARPRRTASRMAVHSGRPALDPQARIVVREFNVTAVARRHLGRAWRLAAPSLRRGLSRAVWLSGDIPVPSYPVVEARAVYAVEKVGDGSALVRVVFEPRSSSTAEWGVYDVGLVLRGGRWLVATYRGSARGCRKGGERDPDPGPMSLWC